MRHAGRIVIPAPSPVISAPSPVIPTYSPSFPRKRESRGGEGADNSSRGPAFQLFQQRHARLAPPLAAEPRQRRFEGGQGVGRGSHRRGFPAQPVQQGVEVGEAAAAHAVAQARRGLTAEALLAVEVDDVRQQQRRFVERDVDVREQLVVDGADDLIRPGPYLCEQVAAAAVQGFPVRQQLAVELELGFGARRAHGDDEAVGVSLQHVAR